MLYYKSNFYAKKAYPPSANSTTFYFQLFHLGTFFRKKNKTIEREYEGEQDEEEKREMEEMERKLKDKMALIWPWPTNLN